MNIYLATSLFVVLLCAISHQAASQVTDDIFATDSPVEDTTAVGLEVTTAAMSRDNKYRKRRICRSIVSGDGSNKKKCRQMECKVKNVYRKKDAKDGQTFCQKLKCKRGDGIKFVKRCRNKAYPPM